MKSSIHTSRCGSIGWRVVPNTKKSSVQLLVRAPTYIAGSVPGLGAYGRQPTDVSLSQPMSFSHSFALPSSLPQKAMKKCPQVRIFLKVVTSSLKY